MIHYAGEATYSTVKLVALGDGQTRTLIVDLRKPPFNLNFQSTIPVEARVRSEDQSVPTPTVKMEGAVLTLEYPEAIPAVSSDSMSPRSQLSIYLFYPGS